MATAPSLFTPGRIGSMTVKNRLVMPPMVRNYGDGKGLVTKRYIDHIASIAKGGVGTLILEASYVSPEGRGFENELSIHSDASIPGFKKLAAIAHAEDAKIGVQLIHGGRQASSKVTGLTIVAPSAIPDPTVQETPHELTIAEIQQLVEAFGAAAGRAKKAHLDFVEIHGAHGYLITQFLSPFSNKRTDTYGGTPTKRMQFLREVYASVRKTVGPDFPILVRLSGDEMVKGGLTIKDTIIIAKELEALGVDALHVSVGNYGAYNQGFMIPPMAQEDGPLLHYAADVKKAVQIPVIAVGKLRTPELAKKALKEGAADFIAIGRTLLADPEWPKKVEEGRLNEINKCIACNQGCISRLFAQQDVWCTVNPKCGREGLFAKKLGPSKKVLIIGGGPAGLTAAKIAAERGHDVTLYEKSKKLGGQVLGAAALPYRKDWNTFIQTLIQQVKQLGVTIHLNTEYTPKMTTKNEFHAAIIAMGSSVTIPNIPGVDRAHVVTARDLLDGWSEAKGNVLVAGGGCMGTQVAELLANEGHKVTLVEATDNVAIEAPGDERTLLLERITKLPIKILTNTKVMEIGPSSVSVQRNDSIQSVNANTVVLCMGSFPNDGLATELKKLVKKVEIIGDAKKPRRVTDAVAEGGLAALAL